MPAHHRYLKSGFTLIELLVVITIIAILFAVLMPTLSRARKQARSVECQNTQRQVGLASLNYADDFGSWLWVKYYPSPGKQWVWHKPLREGNYIEANLIRCPVFPPFSYDYWEAYGTRLYSFPSGAFYKPNAFPGDNTAWLNINRIENPEVYQHFFDSSYNINNTSRFKHQATYVYTNTTGGWAQGNVYLGHLERSNCWFVDGHSEAWRLKDFVNAATGENWDITALLGSDYNPISF